MVTVPTFMDVFYVVLIAFFLWFFRGCVLP